MLAMSCSLRLLRPARVHGVGGMCKTERSLSSLPLPPHRSEFGLQLAYLRVEPADRVRLEGHLLNVTGRLAARFEVVHVAADSLREGVDVLRRREPALASGNGRLGRVDFEKR